MKKLADISLFESYGAQAPASPVSVFNLDKNPLTFHIDMFKIFVKGLTTDDGAINSIRILVRQDKSYAPLLADVMQIQAKQKINYKWYVDTMNRIIASETKRLKALPPEKRDPAYLKEWEQSVQDAQRFVNSLHIKW